MKTIIFDMDDTLLECSVHYNEVKEQFCQFAHHRTHIDIAIIRRILNDIDVACTSLPNAFGIERFPRSFQAVSVALDIINGEAPNPEAAKYSYNIGMSVFDAEYELYPNTIATLNALELEYKFILLTKGDVHKQTQKITKNGLDYFFHPLRTHIVGIKNVDVLHSVLVDHQLAPEDVVYVGDSIRDDIAPANALNIPSIWMQHHRPTWNYETDAAIPKYIINDIGELPELLKQIYVFVTPIAENILCL